MINWSIPKLIFCLLTAAWLCGANNCRAFVGDLKPYPELWTSSEGIGLEAICYTNPKLVQVTEPEFAAVIRVYVTNHRDRSIRRVGSTDWAGFRLEGKLADGTVFSFPPVNRAQSHTWIDSAPGETQGFTIALGSGDAAFLKNGSLVIVGRFYDLPSRKLSTVRAPLSFKEKP